MSLVLAGNQTSEKWCRGIGYPVSADSSIAGKSIFRFDRFMMNLDPGGKFQLRLKCSNVISDYSEKSVLKGLM
ncbi:hypothetical protein HHK36_027361 [Tetracentron sinense]|uniref:Uncharacterized protein n=1 Tax=Tetracentron sinense TaxID=13715 RepID=A0A834YD37_TETSI|nr:hypothetical protein HHK36_027361 [Tetracentron sinense]